MHCTSETIEQLPDRIVQHRELGLLVDRPDPLLAMDAIVAALVAVSTQRYAQVLFVLLYVMGITWSCGSAHATRQALHFLQVPFLGRT